MIGKSISHYRVTEKLGEGGMGEVYRATDTKLGREVALKVLPPVFANDSQRMARFKREAHVLASLNHPNIASIYGLEESDGIHCLVLELVEGPTLAERIKEGAIPLEESLNIAKQIADALEAAHEKGVIHRDLKPANVKVTPEGMVKVLDFGLAKALAEPASEAAMENSPTASILPTHEGVILGTAAYMSPEQAMGKAVDKRADIWAFGVVLFEMLTGKRLFRGENTSETLAAVIKDDPDWNLLSTDTPLKIRELLRRCLQKDSRKRLHDIADARIEIEEVLADPSGTLALPAGGVGTQTAWRRVLPWAVAGVFALVAAVGFWPEPEPIPPPSMRLSVEVTPGESSWTVQGAAAVISPDGTRLAFVTTDDQGQRKLYLRPLDQLQANALSGTEGAANPFFSPDGQWIAFFSGNKLKKVSVRGGAAVTLCDAPNGRGGSWGEDGTIVLAPEIYSGLSRVSSAGGTREAVSTLDKEKGETTHRWPQVLPGGKAVLFTVGIGSTDGNIEVQSLETGERKTLQLGGFYGRYLPTGHLVYMSEATLFAAPFDLARLEVTGPPAPILDDVRTSPNYWSGQFDFSQTGTLVYLTGGGAASEVSIFWMDPEGKTEPLLPTPRDYKNPSFSPDGKRLAVDIDEGGNSDLWVYELERETLSRLTFDEGNDHGPVWTPDGQWVTFASNRGGGRVLNLYWNRADGTGDAERLTESSNSQFPFSWSPDGKVLAFFEPSPGTNMDLWTLPMEGDGAGGLKPGKPTQFLRMSFRQWDPAFSPDGRWIAYQSDESGQFEVYVRPFPGPGGKWQISTTGGRMPT